MKKKLILDKIFADWKKEVDICQNAYFGYSINVLHERIEKELCDNPKFEVGQKVFYLWDNDLCYNKILKIDANDNQWIYLCGDDNPIWFAEARLHGNEQEFKDYFLSQLEMLTEIQKEYD